MGMEHLNGIALIGLSARMPGAPSYRQFWNNLVDGVESVTRFTEEELVASGVPPEVYRAPGYVPAAAVVDGVELFDAGFFGYNPNEAVRIDPQQRLLLECAVEAIEDAGIALDALPESTGVYASSSMNGYLFNLTTQPGFVEARDLFPIVIGNEKDYAATRLAYKLNLGGPALTVQTACSSSLVAVHLACQGLLAGDCDMALAGGVTVKTPHRVGYIHVKDGILSPDGHCRPFDANSGGTIEGNGAGVVVMKRLEDALADKDPIRAVIRGSAINNDGSRKAGYTAPSAEGQAKAIQMAQLVADCEPETIGYIEAHGTGTSLGDPIEIAGITRAFGDACRQGQFCAIGAVKSNIGHLNAAAGIAGIIKTVLVLENRLIPPTLHYESPNPLIDFAASPVYVADRIMEWKPEGTPFRAGVSSFGVGGTNVHAVLEEAPVRPRTEAPNRELLFPVSAKTSAALDAGCERLAEHLEQARNSGCDMAYTMQTGRTGHAHRRVVVADDAEKAARLLRRGDPRFVFGSARPLANPRPAFCFPGQGTQSPGMGRQLRERWPVFRDVFDGLAERLLERTGTDLHQALLGTGNRPPLRQASVIQPAIFCVEYALACLWREWGISPDITMGHSIGEYAAACTAGIMDPEAALDLVAERGRLIESLPPGTMLSVSLPEGETRKIMPAVLSLASINADTLCVVSGPADPIAALESELLEAGIGCRRLETSHAFHSSMMDPILDEFRARAARIRYATPRVPFLSTLTGEPVTEETDWPDYWTRHIRQPVLYGPALARLLDGEPRLLLEVGPGQTLTTLVRTTLDKDSSVAAVASMPKPKDTDSEARCLLAALGQLWCRGFPVSFEVLYGAHDEPQRVPMPAYAFQGKRYWIERSAVSSPAHGAGTDVPRHEDRSEETTEPQRFERPDLDTPYRAPSNRLQHLVVDLWGELLGIEAIGIDDDFYELGGDSLLATQINARLRQLLPTNLSLRKLLEAKTPAQQSGVILSALLRASQGEATPPAAHLPTPATGEELQGDAVDSLLDACLARGANDGWQPIPRVARDRDAFPLSFAQRRQWFLEQLAPGRVHLMPNAVRLRGPLNVDRLESALNELLRRHEALRTVFKVVDGAPMQVIRPFNPCTLAIEDVSGFTGAKREHRIAEIVQREVCHPMDISTGALWRACLIREAAEDHILLFTLHHIITDGWTANLALGEIAVLYNAFVASTPSPLPEPGIQYVDYSYWQQRLFSGDFLQPQIDYWKEKLAGAPNRLQLPTDFPRPATSSYNGDMVLSELSGAQAAAMRTFCEREGATPFMFFGTVLFCLLYRLSGQRDICIGSPVAGRAHPDLERVMGLFVNTVCLRVEVDPEQTFRQLLAEVKRTTLEAYDRQDLPFERLVDELGIERSPDSSPLYQLLYVHQESSLADVSMSGLDLEMVPVHGGGAQFELSVYFATLGERALLRLEYNTDCYERATVEQYGRWLADLCASFCADPEQTIGDACRHVSAQTLPVQLLSTFTVEPLKTHLEYWLEKWSLPTRVTIAPYAQVFQSLMDPDSGVRKNSEGVNLLLIRFEDWMQGTDDAEAVRKLRQSTRELIRILDTVARASTAIHLVFCCPPSKGFAALHGDLQASLEQEAREAAGAFYCLGDSDLDGLLAVETKLDPKADTAGHIPYTQEYFAALGMLLVRALVELGQRRPERIFTDATDVPDRIAGDIPVERILDEDPVAALAARRCGEPASSGAALFVSADRRRCLQALDALPALAVHQLQEPGELESELIRSWAINVLFPFQPQP